MAIKDLILRIKGDSTSLQKETKKASGVLSGFKKIVGTIGAAVGAAFAVRALINFGKEAVRLFDIQAKAETQLLTALKGRKDVQKELIEQAQGLQKITLFGDEETIRAQSLIAAFVKEKDQIKQIIPLVQDMAAAKGMDLAGAADLVAKTLGSSTNAMSRYGIEVTGAVGSSERLTTLVDGLSKAFEGQAQAAAKAGAGPLIQLKNAWGDIKEQIGGAIMPILAKIATWFSSVLPKIGAGFSKFQQKTRDVANGFIDLYNESEAFRIVIGAIGSYIKIVFGAIGLAIKQVVTRVGTLGKVIGAVFRGQFKSIPGIIKEGFGKWIENIGDFGKKAVTDFANGIKANKKAYLEPLKVDSEDQKIINGTFNDAGKKAGGEFIRGITEEIKKIKNEGLPTLTAGIITEGPKNPAQVTGGETPVRSLSRSTLGADAAEDVIASTVEISDAYTIMGQQIYDSWQLAGDGMWDFAEKMNISAQQIGETIADLSSGFVDMFTNMIGAIEDYVEVSKNITGSTEEMAKAQEEASKRLGNAIRDSIKAFIAQGIAAVIANTLKGASGLLGILALPLAGLAGAGASLLFSSLVPSFAGGGIVDSPTLAMVGDNPGRKEAIIPSELWGKIGGGGYIAETRVSGRDLAIILRKQSDYQGRV